MLGISFLLKGICGVGLLVLFAVILFQPPDVITEWEQVDNSRNLTMGGFTIEFVEPYALDTLVMAKRRYSDFQSYISPYDFVLGWGILADREKSDMLDIYQSDRYYSWFLPEKHMGALTVDQVIRSSANVHIIPANADILIVLNRLKPGERVKMSGWLVNVYAEKPNWRWMTSLLRDDTGDGACEIFWVESIN